MTSVINKYQAKFQSAYDKLQSEKISYSDFKSQVTDTDYAQVSSNFTADQIRKQSAVAVLRDCCQSQQVNTDRYLH
jgi:flagellin-like hook-associated protein FlgL